MKSIFYTLNDNWGDGVTKHFIETLCDTPIQDIAFVTPTDYECYLTAGSVMRLCTPKTIIWGTGCICQEDDVGKRNWNGFTNKVYCKPTKIISVRGPRTRGKLLQMGIENVPQVYGDPLFVAPMVYRPLKTITNKYDYGIIPHFVDKYETQSLLEQIAQQNKTYSIIDIQTSSKPTFLIEEIVKCKCIISSSLHGVIVGIACGKPTIYTQFSNRVIGGTFKFHDFLESIGVVGYTPKKNSLDNIIPVNKDKLYSLGVSILISCPFFETGAKRMERLRQWKQYCELYL